MVELKREMIVSLKDVRGLLSACYGEMWKDLTQTCGTLVLNPDLLRSVEARF